MASVTSLMNSTSSTSSLYGNRNVISGLASGMDTESMIENSVAGYKTKISSLQQKMTRLQWKQDAYRNIITQMNGLLSKYTSYTSSTNLFSASFFSKAINTVANGANAGKVSATGKSSSNVSIDSIKQLAQAASYTVGTKHLVNKGSETSEIKWSEQVDTSRVAGSITIEYGGGDKKSGSVFTLNFGEDEVFKNAQEMADAINEKLKDKKVTSSSGTSSADNYLEATAKDGKITISEKAGKGNRFRITSVSGEGMQKIFEETERGSSASSKKSVSGVDLVKSNDHDDYLKEKTINVTLDGKTKSIKLSEVFESDTYKNAIKNTSISNLNDRKNKAFAEALNEKLQSEFNNKVSVSIGANGGLEFKGPENNGSTLKVSGDSDAVNKALGLGEGGYSTTLQTNWTLKKVLGDTASSLFTEPAKNADGDYVDKDGKKVSNASQAAKVATIEINGTKLQFGEDDTIQTVMDKINGSDAGVELKYSSMTGNFAFTAKETGADSRIDIGGTLGKALFGEVKSSDISVDEGPAGLGGTYKKGTDAKFTATVNGQQLELTRSSNTVDLDGLKVTLKDTFDEGSEKITFTTSSDSDKIVDTVKAFVEDYNKLVTELHGAYSTMPLQTSSGKDYLPLTEEELSKNSESYIKNYEEKAKTGLLFGDSDLSNLYSRLTQSVQGTGEVGAMMRSIGISVEYSSGLSTLSLDEEKLRSALDTDPDKVKTAFTASTSTGASSNGIMAGLKNTLEMYGKTSIGSPGILVKKAGTTLSSYSLSSNEIQDQIDNVQKEIEKWQDKMSDRIDFYTNQFTQLEMLINQMNSQSSALSGMMGG